jgi:hypothetical protein
MIRLAALALSFACFALLAVVLASVLSTTACFPTGDSGPGGGGTTSAYSYTNCPNGSQSAPACLECLAGSCGSQVDSVNSACASYLDCLCPPGANAQACATESDDAGASLLTTACNTAQGAIYNCALTYCFDECQPDAG